MDRVPQIQSPQQPPNADAERHELLRLGDTKEAMRVQNALMLLLYQKVHQLPDTAVVLADRLANSEEIRRAAERLWIGDGTNPEDPALPSVRFGEYRAAHQDSMVDVRDRKALEELLADGLGLDLAPITKH